MGVGGSRLEESGESERSSGEGGGHCLFKGGCQG